jgi:RNA ligase (TIGR02306 family)
MAFFGVTKETISEINVHPNADKLEIAKLKNCSFQFIIGKAQLKVGDEVLYFPIDSLVPENVQEILKIKGKLSSPNSSRIKTVRLRGSISQGLVGKLESFNDLISSEMTSEEITEKLGVTKYEPPAIMCKNADLRSLPFGLNVYDIEGCERYGDVVDMLMEQNVIVTEKMEGSNFSITYNGSDLYVNQRRHSIFQKDGEEHTWWRVAKEQDFTNLIKKIQSKYGYGTVVTLYGEMVGPSIQGNIYKFPDNRIYLFDMNVNGAWVNHKDFMNTLTEFGANKYHVPILSEGKTLKEFLNGKKISEVSNGNSVFAETLREGIVIKPEIEQVIHSFGRLIVKQRDQQYLAQSDN